MKNLHTKLVFRRLRKNKYLWINILGFSLGIAVFMTLFLYIQHEYSYEKAHTNLDHLYRLEQVKRDGDEIRKMCGTPPPISRVISTDIPGIINSTRLTGQFNAVIGLDDGTKMIVEEVMYADKSFLEMFTYPVVAGSTSGELDQPYMAVISRELAERLFGAQNAVGKQLNINNQYEVEIRAVTEKLSKKSHLNYQLLISFETLVSTDGEEIINQDWYSNWCRNYVLTDGLTSTETINKSLHGYLKKYQGEESENNLYLKPLGDIHLKSDVVDEFARVGSEQNILIYIIIALFIIAIASINYINLTIAYASERVKEVGIRKVIGATKKRIVFQLLNESNISIVLAIFLALILMELFVPIFNGLVSRDLQINYLDNWRFTGLFLLISIVVGLVTGLIPSRIIANFQPLSMTKTTNLTGRRSKHFRYGLVFFQFFISISLISSTFILFKQYHFLKNKDLGYDKENVLIIGLASPDRQKFHQLKTELEKYPGIARVDCSDYLPMSSTNWTVFSWKGAMDDEYLKMNINYVGPEFTDVYDIAMVQGTGFTQEMADREQRYVLINETALKKLGWDDNPIGKEILWQIDYRTRDVKTAKVAGITRDFHYLTKHQPIMPLIMPLLNGASTGSNLSIKLTPGNPGKRIERIDELFKKIYPIEEFNYIFADDVVNDLYQSEQKMGKLVLSLTLIAIAIAIMGLIGLVSYTANLKTKEIGIRKVNGASMAQIVHLLSADFTRLLIAAFLLSCPVAYMVMQLWMRNFAYKTGIPWWIFVLTIGSILVISLFSVSYQTIKASLKNPVDALRYE